MYNLYLILCSFVLCLCVIQQTSATFAEPVQNLTVVALNSTALNISFVGTVAPDVLSYSVTVASGIRGTSEVVQITTNIGMLPNYEDQVLEVGGLFPFTEYTVTVVGNLAAGMIGPAIQMATTEQAVPAGGRISSINIENASTIGLAWFAPAELQQNGPITCFIIDFSNSIIPGPYTQVFATTVPYPISFIFGFSNDFTVEEGITYNVSVRAVNGAGAGASSDSVLITTPIIAPPSVVPFTLLEITNFTLNPTCVSFLVPTPTIPFLNGPLLDYTIVYVGTLLSSDFFQSQNTSTPLDVTSVETVSVPAGNNITVCDFLPNYSYQVNVSARNAEGSTLPLTLEITFPPAAPSGIPLNLTLQVVSYQQIDVSWSIDISTVNGELRSFNIFYFTSGYSNVVVYSVTNSTGPYQVSVTGLSPNTLYSVDVSIVNEVAQGSPASAVAVETFPQVPGPLQTTTAPTESSSTTIQIYVPTQRLFPTADIAVIYIISDSSNPPLFSTYTADQRYNSVTTTSNGVILVDGADTIRIQAILDASYYNQPTNYILFTVGDGETFSFNGSIAYNIPLLSFTSYQISYYILFYDKNEQISPEFSFYSIISTAVTSKRDICLACFLLPICAFIAIIFIIVFVTITLIFYYMWDKREKKLTPPEVTVSPNEQPITAVDSLVLINRRMSEPSYESHDTTKDTKV